MKELLELDYSPIKKTQRGIHMKFEIITDSSATLPKEIIVKFGIQVLSLSYFIDEEEFLSYERGKENDLSYFYEKLRNKSNIRTSLVNTQAALTLIEELLKEGKDVLYIGFSSGLSGTYQSVSLAMEDLKESYPERRIVYMDSLAASLGEGLLVYEACKLREEGKNIDEVFEWLETNKLHLCHWFSVDDLFFLKRGGRISTAAAVFGSALSVKPVMHVDNEGHLIVMSKARGRKKAIQELANHLFDTVENPEDQVMGISHADCEEDAVYLKNMIMEKYKVKEFIIEPMEPVIASHTGPGCLALFFFGKER